MGLKRSKLNVQSIQTVQSYAYCVLGQFIKRSVLYFVANNFHLILSMIVSGSRGKLMIVP